MNKHSTITACILHKDQSKKLERALSTVQWCDQRIIFDDNSLERPDALSKQYHASLVTQAVGSDFAAARNLAESLVQTDWILWIDADEFVSSELAIELQQILNVSKYSAVSVQRVDTFLGKTLLYGETSHVHLVRMVRKGMGKWSGKIHEVWNVSGTIKSAQNPLFHVPHDSLSAFMEKIIRYAKIAALENHTSRFRSWLELTLFPLGKFFVNFILLSGWRDGFPGLSMAYMMSLHSFLVRVYRLEQGMLHA